MKIFKKVKKFLMPALALGLVGMLFSCGPSYDEGDAFVGYGSDGYTQAYGSGTAQCADDYDFDTLVWSDEFNGPKVDTAKWNFETGNGNWGWGNGELEYYTAGNNTSFVSENGETFLRITAKSDLTSTRMTTKNKWAFRYGRIVAKIRYSSGNGSWPAFWMLGTGSGRWPQCGEIDIMEHANNDKYYSSTLHWHAMGPAYNGGYDDSTHKSQGSKYSVANTEEWHQYGIYWKGDELIFTFDGKKVTRKVIGDEATKCFQYPAYFILNFAMGGNFVGRPSKNTFENLPWNMDVDYIRVYQ